VSVDHEKPHQPLISRLLFDGTRIQDDQTAQDLEMEEGDSIEVLLERELRMQPVVSLHTLTLSEVGGC